MGERGVGPPGVEQAGTVGDGGCLHPRRGVELAQDVGDVNPAVRGLMNNAAAISGLVLSCPSSRSTSSSRPVNPNARAAVGASRCTCGVAASRSIRARRARSWIAVISGTCSTARPAAVDSTALGQVSATLPPQLAEALRTHRAEQTAERLRAGSEWSDHGLVFAQPNGKPIEPRNDYRAWKSLLRAAGVRDARLHDARHTAATLLLSQGVQARVAMEILGHSQISLTLGTYSHVVPELQQDAAERVGRALCALWARCGDCQSPVPGRHFGSGTWAT